jgi:hypothetical protein
VAHGVARVVDDVDLPLGGGVCDFEAVGRWGVVLGSWYIEGLGAAGLTVEIDGGCGESAAGEERGKNCGFGEHVDVLIGDYRD